jgi:copper chaperone CopZ
MNTLKFKTNINCNGCLSKVSPFLEKDSNIENWEVDLQSEDRILTVETKQSHPEQVIHTVEKAGFVAEQLD